MAEGYGYFGREVKTSGKLHQMLDTPDLTPEQLFSIPNISGDITQNIQTFLSFCNKRREFTTKMLGTCFNSEYSDLSNDDLKRIAQYTIEVLTNDDAALSDFLFSKQEQITNTPEIEQDNMLTDLTIQSQAERLFSDSNGLSNKKQQAPSWQSEPNCFKEHDLIKITLEHLKPSSTPKNETCLGYLNKLYSSLLRRQGNRFLHFLQDEGNEEYLYMFINNLEYYAVGGIVALMLSCEDRTGEYKYEGLKTNIFKRILAYGINNLSNREKFEGFIVTCEQILSSTKQSYYQYFQDFKRCANTLVSQETLEIFFQSLWIGQQHFSNSSTYLQLILKRINNQNEQPDYYKNNDTNQSTMQFQHQFLYTRIGDMIKLLEKSRVEKYSSMNCIAFLGFFVGVLRNMDKKGVAILGRTFADLFTKIAVIYAREGHGGLVKNYMFQILKLVVKRLQPQQAKELSEWLLTSNIQLQLLTQLFPTSQASIYASNSNTRVCYILSLLFDMQNREPQFLSKYNAKHKISLSQPYERYQTKIMNTSQDEDMISPLCDDYQGNFSIISRFKAAGFLKDDDPKEKDNKDNKDANDNKDNKDSKDSNNKDHKEGKKDGEREREREEEVQLVGKNSVIIPVLNLPNKLEAGKIVQQSTEPVKTAAELSRQALIRDLKSTKFDLPDKFMRKKVNKDEEEQKQKQQEKPKQVKPQANETSKKEVSKVAEKQQETVKAKPQALKLTVRDANPLNAIQQKYYIRHILLF